MPYFRDLPDNPVWVQVLRVPKAANDDNWFPPKDRLDLKNNIDTKR